MLAMAKVKMISKQGGPEGMVQDMLRGCKETLLQKEYDRLTEDLHRLSRRISKVELENISLEREAGIVHLQMVDVINDLSKLHHGYNNAITRLSNQNQRHQAEMRREKKIIVQMHEREKKRRAQLLDMEDRLSTLVREVAELRHYRDQRAEQLARIKDLEREVFKMRASYIQNVQSAQSEFILYTIRLEEVSRKKVTHPPSMVMKDAGHSLQDQVKLATDENLKLRDEMLHLMHHSHLLNTCILKLQQQHKVLLREVDYTRYLTRIRCMTPCRRHQNQQVGELKPSGDVTLSSDLAHLHHKELTNPGPSSLDIQLLSRIDSLPLCSAEVKT
ncbi:coiled-coil domain-containing protein 166 [Pseudophryne corroboree]|uniref:coiled-coil domain-containing protein 166 n=1 Tax=Pseudophryne corroboree TaxID=495146 RepID=UPI003081CDFF